MEKFLYLVGSSLSSQLGKEFCVAVGAVPVVGRVGGDVPEASEAVILAFSAGENVHAPVEAVLVLGGYRDI